MVASIIRAVAWHAIKTATRPSAPPRCNSCSRSGGSGAGAGRFSAALVLQRLGRSVATNVSGVFIWSCRQGARAGRRKKRGRRQSKVGRPGRETNRWSPPRHRLWPKNTIGCEQGNHAASDLKLISAIFSQCPEVHRKDNLSPNPEISLSAARLVEEEVGTKVATRIARKGRGLLRGLGHRMNVARNFARSVIEPRRPRSERKESSKCWPAVYVGRIFGQFTLALRARPASVRLLSACLFRQLRGT